MPNISQSRIILKISKNFGNAVKRNRIRRIIKEQFRQNKLQISGYDILITLNNKITTEIEEEVVSNFKKLLKHLEIVK